MSDDPRWVRPLLATVRTFGRVLELEAMVRDEVLWSCVPAERRDAVTAAIYAREPSYSPGGAVFERRLHLWEERLLAREEVPRSGRVLVGGAGGGRELRALAERGYAVTAFEPCAELVRAAQGVAAGHGASRVLRGSYRDAAGAVRGEGPLASLRQDAPYALVVLGWRSLSHVLEEEERIALFASLARLAPGAPIVASFLPRGSGTPRVGRARSAVRRALAALGAPAAPPAGAAFIPSAGFAVSLAREDIERLAGANGYALAVCETGLEGVALFVRR